MEQTRQWVWNPEDQFQVDGRTIETFTNLVQSILNDPASAKVIWAIRADEMLGQVLNKGIQDGLIKEKIDFVPNDQNHYSNASGEEFYEMTGLLKDSGLVQGKDTKDIEIFDWEGYQVFGKYWMPNAELRIFQKLKSEGKKSVVFGYVDGQVHHALPETQKESSGYVFFYTAD